MGLDDVLAFVHVVHAGGFASAGRITGTSKATLSRQVARLEERLGVRLLQRTTRKVGLTEAGAEYYRRCRSAVDALEEADADALARSTEPRGRLRVSAPFEFTHNLLPRFIVELRTRYPGIELEIVSTPRKVDLIAEDIDVAIRGGMLADSSLIARKLVDSRILFCASPAYLEKNGAPVHLDELRNLSRMMHPGPAGGWPVMGPEGVVIVPADGWLVVNDWGLLRSAARDGLGIALVEEHAVAADVANGDLIRVLGDHEVRGGALFAVFPSARNLSPKVRVFVDLLAERVGALAAEHPPS